MVGNRRRFVLGKHSGRAAVRAMLSAGGRTPTEASVERLLRLAKGRGRRERTRFI
jgi:isopropylmalate/homocitrate/citramalate synthase